MIPLRGNASEFSSTQANLSPERRPRSLIEGTAPFRMQKMYRKLEGGAFT